jgi:hypothetical protein
MKSLLHLTAAAAFAVHSVAGHYIFQQFTAGGVKYPAWKYVRRNSNPAWLQNGPVTDLSSTDLRCNVGGQTSNGTETVTMNAGDQFTFTLDTAVYHAGPVSLYMSKAPGAAADYDGSGQWFKIYDWGPSGWDWPMRGEFYCLPNRYRAGIDASIQTRTPTTFLGASPMANTFFASSRSVFTTQARHLR